MLIATAREFLRKHCPPETAQRLALDARGFDETLWRRMAELGWPGLLIPGDLGGSDGSLLDVVLLVEEMGRAGLPGPFVTSAVVATSILLAAGAQRSGCCPRWPRASGSRRWRSSRSGGSFDPAGRRAPLRGARPADRRASSSSRTRTSPPTCSSSLRDGDLLLLPADRARHRAAAAGHAERREALRGHVRRGGGARRGPAGRRRRRARGRADRGRAGADGRDGGRRPARPRPRRRAREDPRAGRPADRRPPGHPARLRRPRARRRHLARTRCTWRPGRSARARRAPPPTSRRPRRMRARRA